MGDYFESHVLGTVYGNCIGDAIGLLTEFMNKAEAKEYYHKQAEKNGLEYNLKIADIHRARWETGDWTDDSDQMILMIDSILDKNGEVNAVDYCEKLMDWFHYGFPELGDHGGLGIGATTFKVFRHPAFKTDPHTAAQEIWEKSGRFIAPNGAVMRTSILGVFQYKCLDSVKRNTLELCKVTHADPRCQASCIAVTVAIATMLNRDSKYYEKGQYNVKAIIDFAYNEACKQFEGLENEEGYKQELHDHMYAKQLKSLQLDERDKIGYTYKTLGAGFWALKQTDFRKALTEIVMEAGDADTNGAVAGALLGCKLGHKQLPESWLYQMANKDWLDQRLRRFMNRSFPDVKLMILPSAKTEKHLEEHIMGTLYGNCIGDAIGLLTEFMTKAEAAKLFQKKNEKGEIELDYEQKNTDRHRQMWATGDWTDDTDQMILIIDSLLARNGDVDPRDYGERLKTWARYGFPELNDIGGCGLGATTNYVLKHEVFERNPHEAARDIWERSGCNAAPNGAVMRTSVLGIYRYPNIHRVKRNTLRICRVTHADPRCAASCLAVTCAIAYMLQRIPRHFKNGSYNLDAIIQDAYTEACTAFDKDEMKKYGKELKKHMNVEKLADLKLDEAGKIGYTFKTLGAGFWALRQHNFKKALTAIVMEAGDADTNGAVAGALLGCKLGYTHLAEFVPGWLFQLRYKDWFDQKVRSFLGFAFPDLPITKLPEQTAMQQNMPNISNLDPQNASSSHQQPRSHNVSATASRGHDNKSQPGASNDSQGTSPNAAKQEMYPSVDDENVGRSSKNLAPVHQGSKSTDGQAVKQGKSTDINAAEGEGQKMQKGKTKDNAGASVKDCMDWK